MSVILAVAKFEPYLWGGKAFTLITDCAALMWFIKRQAISLKYHR